MGVEIRNVGRVCIYVIRIIISLLLTIKRKRKMKTHQTVSSQRRKSRKAHFSAPTSIRRKIMSSHLSKDLRAKYSVRSIPVRKGDTVKIMRGNFKGREGKVQAVYRKRWALHIEKIVRDKTNGKTLVLLLSILRNRPTVSDPHCLLQRRDHCS